MVEKMDGGGHNRPRNSYAIGFEVIKLMEPVIDKLESGLCAYHDGWNDDRMLAHCNASMGMVLSKSTIKTAREQMFGKTRNSPGTNASYTQVMTLMAELEQRIAKLEQMPHNSREAKPEG